MKVKPIFSITHFLLLVLGSVALESCSSTAATTITGSWKAPEAKTYRDFFVAVLSKNLPARSTLEIDIARKLKSKDVKVAQSLDIFPHSEELETKEQKKAAVEKIQSLGHDAIITVTLIKHTEESRYSPGANSYTPTSIGTGTGYFNPATGENPGSGNYGAFGVYYMDASSAYTTPGYYETDKLYFVQSNVYDAATAKLVWSAQSETFDPGNLAAASSDFSTVMVAAMKKAGIIAESK